MLRTLVGGSRILSYEPVPKLKKLNCERKARITRSAGVIQVPFVLRQPFEDVNPVQYSPYEQGVSVETTCQVRESEL